MVKKSKVDAWAIGAGIIVVAVAAFLIAGGGDYLAFTGGDTFEPTYPFAVQDRIYQPVWGTINCQHTGGVTGITQPTPYDCGSVWIGNAGLCADFVCGYIGGCKIRSISGECPTLGGWFGYSMYIGDTRYYLPLELDYGQSVKIYTICSGLQTRPKSIDIDIVGEQAKLKVESYGYTKAGWLAGSDNCKLVSVDVATLKLMQDKSGDELKGIEQISMGVTKHIIAGWREDPAFGTINTCGKYQNQDVVCKPYQGIYSLQKIYTQGNINYWTAGSILKSYTDDNTMCCCAGDCAAGYTCEGYRCVEEAVTCQYGQCPWGVSQCEHVGGCFQEGGRFYLRQAYCDADKCCQYTEEEVMCCRDYCDAMSTPTVSYYCDYDVGCVETHFQKECPSGYCCIEGGEWKVQNCLPEKECCIEDTTDPYSGPCKDVCGGKPPEDNCYTNCTVDEDCGLGITIPGMMCRVKCQIMCWLYAKLWYFVAGTALLLLFFGWKAFKRASPHARAAKVAYGAYKGAKRR